MSLETGLSGDSGFVAAIAGVASVNRQRPSSAVFRIFDLSMV